METKIHPVTISIADEPLLGYWAELALDGPRGYTSTMIRNAVEHYITTQSFLTIARLRFPTGGEHTYQSNIVFRPKNEPAINHWINTLKNTDMSIAKAIRYILLNSIDIAKEDEEEFMLDYEKVVKETVSGNSFEQALLQKTVESAQQVTSVLQPEHIRRNNMATIISVTNQKGGVGKTVTSMNLAAGLVEAGKKTLLIDCDPQGSVALCFGYNKDSVANSLGYALMQLIMGFPYDAKSAILHHEKTGLDLILSNNTLSNVESFLTSHQSEDVKNYTLKKLVDMVRDDYDYIILDTPPNLHAISLGALACSDTVLIPCAPASLAIESFKQLINTILVTQRSINPNLSVCGLVITQMKGRQKNDVDGCEYIRNNFGKYIRVYDFEIPTAAAVENAIRLKDSLFHVAPKDKVTQAYRMLIQEVLNYGK